MFQQDELLFIKKQMDQRLAAHSGTVALPWHLFLLSKTLLTLSSLIHNWLSLLCHFHIPVQQRRELRLWRRRESGGHLHISFTSSVNRWLGMQPFFWAALVSLSNGLWVLRINSITIPSQIAFDHGVCHSTMESTLGHRWVFPKFSWSPIRFSPHCCLACSLEIKCPSWRKAR